MFRAPDMGKMGRILFISGAALLSFSAVCLMRTGSTYLEIQSTTLLLFAVGGVLVLVGETMRVLSRDREPRSTSAWIEALRGRKNPFKIERILRDSECAFCGKRDAASPASRKGERPAASDSEPNSFGRCLNCGRTVCPRCAYLKGMEMGRKSLRCPGCGGQVY